MKSFNLRISEFDEVVGALVAAAKGSAVYIDEYGKIYSSSHSNHDEPRVRLLDPIELLQWGINFEKVDGEWGYWYKGEFQSKGHHKSDALWATIDDCYYDGNFDPLINHIHDTIDLLNCISIHSWDTESEYRQYIADMGYDPKAILASMK